MSSSRVQQLKADLSLILVALVWGATFVAVKNAVADMPPFRFIAIRFAIACLFLLLLFPRKPVSVDKRNFFAGITIGLFLFGGYSFQTIGLKFTTASNAGFITGLSVVMVPLFLTLATRRLPGLYTFTGVVSATIGLALLSLGPGFSLNRGDWLVFLCAISFAMHIISVGKFAPNLDATALAIIQIATVAAAASLTSLAWESQPLIFTRDVWIGLLVTAIPATSLAFLIQTRMQKFTTSTRTAIIFTSEPVFSAMFAYILAGEKLTSQGMLGAALVLAGMLLSELKSGKPEEGPGSSTDGIMAP